MNSAAQNFFLGYACSSQRKNLRERKHITCSRFEDPIKENETIYPDYENLLSCVADGDLTGIRFNGPLQMESRAWFLRGLCEEADVTFSSEHACCFIHLPTSKLAKDVASILGYQSEDLKVTIWNLDQIDLAHDILFIAKMENRPFVSNVVEFCRRLFQYDQERRTLQCGILKSIPGALFPTKTIGADATWDLTAIAVHRHVGPRTWLLETGLCIKPEPYWFAFVLPDSSLASKGFMIPNSPSLVDGTYDSTLKILVHLHEPVLVTLPYTEELPCPAYPITETVHFPLHFPVIVAQIMFMKRNHAILPVHVDKFKSPAER